MAVQVVVVLAVVLAAIGFLLLTASLLTRRGGGASGPGAHQVVGTPVVSDAAPAPAPPAVAAHVPDSPEVLVARRSFLNRAWLLAMSFFGVGFGITSLGFLWPQLTGGFGGRVRLDRRLPDILEQIASERRPFYSAEARCYLVPYDTSDPENPYVKAGVAAQGVMTLYQKCPHLGCRVPFCESSQWFECPCHGSKYNFAGEVQPGSPAPAGLWRFAIEVEDGVITIDTASPTAQPPKGEDTIRQPPAGSHCV